MTMPDFLFAPTPHTEAVDFIKSKPVVSREVFNNLLPDLRARSFLITGVEAANVAQGIRDRIADLPAGANWDDVKKDIVADLHPFLANDEDPDNTIAAERRAELLIRMHGFQAYQAAQHNVMEHQKDVFPYWQYHTMEDDRVRPEHAALDGIVLPADHEFWQHHYPPWNFGCRCQVIPVSQDDYDDIKKEDEKQPPDQKDILDDYAQRDLTATRRLVRNGVSYNVTAPAEEGKPGAFRWHPGDMRIPVEDLRGRYDAATWADFESNARKQSIPEYNLTVWEWLSGKRLVDPTAPVTLPVVASKTFLDALAGLGLDKKVQWAEQDVTQLFASLKQGHGEKAGNYISEIIGATQTGPLGRAAIISAVQDIVDILPASHLANLPKLKIEVHRMIPKSQNALGDYGGGRLRLSKLLHKQHPSESPKSTMYHELMHWVHRDMKGSSADSYRAAISHHYATRTAGDAPIPDGEGGCLRKDQWWKLYAGREYFFERGKAGGLEVPTVYFQLFATPKKMVEQMDLAYNPHAGHFLETLKVVMGIFFT